ncbi:MAG TPA: DUF4199 domain-containing protein [Flavobacteriaceae bacterium]|nr:DUF4199 domain-containing protein [Flavobacteriaceae bacterium]
METTSKKAFQKLALNYGLLLGLFSVLLSVVVYSMGSFIEKPLWSTIAITFIGFGVTYYAILQYRTQLGGFLTLGQAMKLGVAIALIAGIIASLSNYIFMTYIEPDTVEKMIELGRQQLEESPNALSDEQIEMSMEMSRKFMQPWLMAAMGILSSVFMGVIYSLVAGLILQKKKPIA